MIYNVLKMKQMQFVLENIFVIKLKYIVLGEKIYESYNKRNFGRIGYFTETKPSAATRPSSFPDWSATKEIGRGTCFL